MLAGADSVEQGLGGVVPGNVCNAVFLTVRIQIDSCPFRSTQRHYCALDSAVVLLLTQSPLRFLYLLVRDQSILKLRRLGGDLVLPSTLGLLYSLSA